MSILLKAGDRVVCKVKDITIVPADQMPYDEKVVFEIISVSYQGWHIYIPSYMLIKNTVPITSRNHKSLGIAAKFIGEEAVFIGGSFIVKVDLVREGLFCTDCGEYFEHAKANQPDDTLICWSCRHYPTYR